MRQRRWAWSYLTAASILATSHAQTSAPVAVQTSLLESVSIPGGSPTGDAESLKSIYYAKSLRKSDLSERSDSTFPRVLPEANQIQALDRLCDALVQSPLAGRVISIHAVRSAGTVLDVLESHGLLIPNSDSPVIIFHWFSGTSDELVRARNAGCYFSVNERMLATKRGREYARQIPLDRLLLETDAPAEPNTETSAQSLIRSLTRTSMRIASLKNCDAKRIESAVLANAHSVFDLR